MTEYVSPTIGDMGTKKHNTPDVWYEKDIELDIIDDCLFG
jgi:hypothetical protein